MLQLKELHILDSCLVIQFPIRSLGEMLGNWNITVLQVDSSPSQCQLRYNLIEWLECYPHTKPASLSFYAHCCISHFLCLLCATSHTSQLMMHVTHPSSIQQILQTHEKAHQWVSKRRLPWQHILSHVAA